MSQILAQHLANASLYNIGVEFFCAFFTGSKEMEILYYFILLQLKSNLTNEEIAARIITAINQLTWSNNNA